MIRITLSIASGAFGSDECAPPQSSCAELTSHCLVGEAFESKASVRVPRERLLRCGQPRKIACTNTYGILSAFRSSDIEAMQDAPVRWIYLMGALVEEKEIVWTRYLSLSIYFI